MSSINTNVNALIAQRVLGQNNALLTRSLERLSTGLRINRGADDPAGLIASEKLRSEKASISAALSNAQRADQVVNIAEGSLQEVSSLLLQLQGLVGQTASDAAFSIEEQEANQAQIDNILSTIDRIAATTSFEGVKLLNGTFDFKVSGQSASISDVQVNGAKIPAGTGATASVAVKAVVVQSAQHGGMFLSAGAAALNLTANSSTFVFELAGAKGSQSFSFSSGTAIADVVTSINNFKDVTGVSAKVSGTGVVLKTTEFGSEQFVSFKVTNAGGQAGGVHLLSSINEARAKTAAASTFAAATNAIRDEGQDIVGTINGLASRGRGKTLSVNTDQLAVSFTLSTGIAQVAGSTSAFTITGGGAKFNLGPTVDLNNEVRLGIGNISARNLGNNTTGFLDSIRSGADNNIVNGDVTSAQEIVGKAIDQITSLRGRLGSFQSSVVGSTINSLSVALENISAAESAIRDTDFAAETANLTRAQILVQAATTVAGLANSAPQNILRLLS